MKLDIKLKLSKRIRELRKTNNLTQEQLADLSGVDYKHIQLLESNNPPAIKIDTLEKISKTFNISCSQILDFDD